MIKFNLIASNNSSMNINHQKFSLGDKARLGMLYAW